MRALAVSARALLRLLAMLAWTAPCYAAWIACTPLALVAPSNREAARRGLLRLWARGVARVLGMRVEVEGRVPAPPFLLCTNHLSYVDVLALGSLIGGVFLSKSEVARWPLIGFLARTTGTLFVERGRKADVVRALRGMRATLARGTGVAFFPEGTSTDGSELLPFKSSLFEAAREAGVAVHCAALAYETPAGAPPARLAVCWWGEMGFAPHLWSLLRLPGFRVQVRFAAEPVPSALDRRALALEARARVAALRPRSAAPPSPAPLPVGG